MQTAKPAVSRVSKPTAPRDARATSTADQHIGLERLGAEGFASGLCEDGGGEGGESGGGRGGLDELAAGGVCLGGESVPLSDEVGIGQGRAHQLFMRKGFRLVIGE